MPRTRINAAIFASLLMLMAAACTQGIPTPTPTLSPLAVRNPALIVRNAEDSGPGSLRAAIEHANGNPGTDTISFQIPGPGPHTIQPASILPAITDPVVIDGYTQPGARPANSNSNAVLKIELDGSNAGTGAAAIGLHITAGGSTVKGLVINRFYRAGIQLETDGGNVIAGNFIGTDVAGTVDLGNGEGLAVGIACNGGVEISDSSDNIIGGTTPEARNVISGNLNGVGICNAHGNTVQGNYIGTDGSGENALGNSRHGIAIISGLRNLIGGTTSGARNILSANGDPRPSFRFGNGLLIAGASSDPSSASKQNLVQGNYIGVDVTGTAVLPNGGFGVEVRAAGDNIIGGTTPGARNIISGNTLSGVGLNSGVCPTCTTGNLVQGNFIGTDFTGTVDLGNNRGGVSTAGATENTIGGTASGAGNIISGNGSEGIFLHSSEGNVVQGNYIGTDATGAAPLGNDGPGVRTWLPNDNIIGGTASGAGNIIAHNSGSGIVIRGAPEPFTVGGNAILSNSIYSNGGLGIDLSIHQSPPPDGVTPNDVGDTDTGVNEWQNFPVLSVADGDAVIRASLKSTPNTPFRIEFFANTVCDPSGHGEGETFLGFRDVSTDADGESSVSFSAAAANGQFVTATATGPDGSTSEFSQCTPTTVAAPTSMPTATPTPTTTVMTTATNIVIDCIFFDGLVPRTEADEYVQITNWGPAPEDMVGWVLVDVDEGFPRFVFPSFVLVSGQTIRVYTNQVHPEWGSFSFASGRAVWNNGSPDLAVLSDASGVEVSRMSYPPGC